MRKLLQLVHARFGTLQCHRADVCRIKHRPFFESFFAPELTGRGRSRRHPVELLDLWRELDGRDLFPADDLVPIGGGRGTFTLAGLFRWLAAGMPHSVAVGLEARERTGVAGNEEGDDEDDDSDDTGDDDGDWEAT